MALLDLSSDLSRYRSEVSKVESNTPEASKATQNKNFATVQPITAKLSSLSPKIKKPESVKKLENKLSSTKLDDIRKFAEENLLMNSVSKYSPGNIQKNNKTLGRNGLTDIVSTLNKIQQKEFVSRLDKSGTVIVKPSTEKNKKSPITNIVKPSDEKNTKSPVKLPSSKEVQKELIKDPKVQIIKKPFVFEERTKSSPNIISKKDAETNSVTDPKIEIVSKPKTIDRKKQTININKGLASPINNIVNPNIALDKTKPVVDRKNESPNIIQNTVKQGLVVDPNTKVFKIEQGTYHLKDESKLNRDDKPVKFSTSSRLTTKRPQKDLSIRIYSKQSNQLKDNSNLNLDKVVKTIPFGRNENSDKSKYSIHGNQAVNFFSDKNADGFKIFVLSKQTSYKVNSSQYGLGKDIPEVDFFDKGKKYTTKGFEKFAKQYVTRFRIDSSILDWHGKSKAAPETNFFDKSNTYTTKGFEKFAQAFITRYVVNASKFGFKGTKQNAPSTNFFDDSHATGFTKFAQQYKTEYQVASSLFTFKGKLPTPVDYFNNRNALGFVVQTKLLDTKYIPDSSVFTFVGTLPKPVDFFSNGNASGFILRTKLLDTKYVPESSVFDWDGARDSAPTVNYFDITNKNTTAGFHKFAQTYDTKYVPESSIFDWDGTRTDAPQVNYFDITSKNTTAGFHRFAQIYDTKYVPESSIFDWDGAKTDAPHVNYFDINGKNTTSGFHTFAQLYDTKYVPESSGFDWDGKKPDAPHVNYFDITSKNTTAGFHTFAQIYDTKYVPESSIFDWDGKRPDAPHVNYFDISAKNTTAGFHTLAQLYDTKYVPESSRFDWDGKRPDAPHVNYFDIGGKNTTAGFHTLAQLYDTKYVPESSGFDWDGKKENAPEVNYFDIQKKFTSAGFHRLAEKYDSKYVKESSEFDWDGSRSSSPQVNYFDIQKKYTTAGFHRLAELYDTKYVKGSSIFDWDGDRKAAPKTNFFADKQATGFTTLAEKLKSEYKKDSSEFTFKGAQPKAVDFFGNKNATGFTNKFSSLDTKYIKDTSAFTFKGAQPTPVDFFPNTNASGFTNKIANLESKFVTDTSAFTFKGAQPSPVDFFQNTKADGFTVKMANLESKYQVDTSDFTFKGSREGAKSVDFLANTFAAGFTKLTDPLKTEFDKKESSLTWAGDRSKAPSVNFFGIANSDVNGIDGFTALFTDKTATKYSDTLSSLSIESSKRKSLVKNVPYTNFFGFNSGEQSGFMVNMSTFDGTLYPIVEPTLRYDYDKNSRLITTTARSESGALKTTNLEKYAPASLGKRPWTDGTLYSTLDTQIPNIKTKAAAGSYLNKYEQTMKSATKNIGYLTQWANGDILTQQYHKYRDWTPGGGVVPGKTASTAPYKINKTERLANVGSFDKASGPGGVGGMGSGLGVGDISPNADADVILRRTPTGATEVQTEPTESKSTTTGNAAAAASSGMQNLFAIDGDLSTKEGRFKLLMAGLQAMNPPPYIPKGVEAVNTGTVLDYLLDQTNANSTIRSAAKFISSTGLPGVAGDYLWGKTKGLANGLYESSGLRGVTLKDTSMAILGFDIGDTIMSFPEYIKQSYEQSATLKEIATFAKDAGNFVSAAATTVGKYGKTASDLVTGVSSFLDWKPEGKSRMIGLMKELLPNSFSPIVSNLQNDPLFDKIVKTGLSALKGSKIAKDATAWAEKQGNDLARRLGIKEKSYADLLFDVIANRTNTIPKDFKHPTGSTSNADAGAFIAIQLISMMHGGPNSWLGIGQTLLTRARHPYLTVSGTTPELTTNQNKNPSYNDASRRDTHYALTDPYGQTSMFAIDGKPKIVDEESAGAIHQSANPKKAYNGGIKGIIHALTQMLDSGPYDETVTSAPANLKRLIKVQEPTKTRIENLSPFTPKYDTLKDRLKAITWTSTPGKVGSDLHLGPSDQIKDFDSNPIKKYRVLSYDALQKTRPGVERRSARFNDFRLDLDTTGMPSGSVVFVGEGKNARYDRYNLEDKYGLGNPGKPGAQRNLPFVTNVIYGKGNYDQNKDAKLANSQYSHALPVLKDPTKNEFRGDRINIIDYKRTNSNVTRDLVYEKKESLTTNVLPGADDLVDFYFTSLTLSGHKLCPAEIIVFRAIFDSISDNHKPSWNSIKYIGRGDPAYIYQGYERSISFGFTVHIGSRDEMKATWRKLNYLASWTAPEYVRDTGYMRGPLIRLNIGNLYRKMPGYLSSLTYTFDNSNGYWETAHQMEDEAGLNGANAENVKPGVLQLPKIIQVSCEFVPIGVYRPEYRGVFYSLYDDAGDPETGLIPKSATAVNYFRTYDDDNAIASTLNKEYMAVPPGEESDVSVNHMSVTQANAKNAAANPPAAGTSAAGVGAGNNPTVQKNVYRYGDPDDPI